MMSGFRSFAKSKLALVLFGGLIVAFGFGVGTSDPFRGISGGGFLRAGDRSIGERDANRLLDRQIDAIREQSGEVISQRQAAERGIPNSIVAQLEQQTQILAYTDKMGIGASSAAVADIIANAPIFKDALGRVDMNAVREYAAKQKYRDVAEFQKDFADSLTLGYLDEALFAGVATPDILLKPAVSFLGETRGLTVGRLTKDSLPAPKPPTEEELQAFYTERSAMFAQPERRRISVLSYTPSDFIDKVEIKDTEMKAEYDRRIKDFSTPETREFLQLTSKDQNAVQAVVDSVKQGQALEDAAGKTTGVDLITLTAKPADLADAKYSAFVFSLPTNDIFGPVQVGDSWYAVEVKSITPGEATPFDLVKDQVRERMARREADRMFKATEETFYDMSGGATSLADIAKEMGVPVIEIAAVDANGRMERRRAGDKNVFTRYPDALKNMFKLNVGEMSDVLEGQVAIEMSPDGETESERALFHLDEIVPPRTPSLDEVRAELTQLYLATKTQEAATKAADDVVAAVKAGSTFEAAAAKAKMASQKMPPITRQQQGLDPAILGAVFSQEVGSTAVVQDSRGEPWVVRVDTSAPATPEVEAQIRVQVSQQINQSVSSDLGEAFLRAVQKAVKLKTNDTAINKYLASFTKNDDAQ